MTKPEKTTRATVHVSIDVPELEPGLRFYGAVFGFVEVSRPFAEMAILDANNVTVCMHAKAEGSRPAPRTEDARHYQRHWTPVHLDLHVHDFEEAVERVRSEGGQVEQVYRDQGPRPAAFCCDPFGNGFCIIGERAAQD